MMAAGQSGRGLFVFALLRGILSASSFTLPASMSPCFAQLRASPRLHAHPFRVAPASNIERILPRVGGRAARCAMSSSAKGLQEQGAAGHGEGDGDRPKCYVVVNNLQSGGNIGRIVRSASIFGAAEVVVVGQRKWRLHGLHGYVSMPQKHFYTLEEAQEYLTVEKGAEITGVEIMEGASPVMKFDRKTGVATFPFRGNTAFVVGNEGTGLSEKQRGICSSYLYIPHVRGGGGSGSLNVACASSIVLQAFSTWAGYDEAPRDGEKFDDDSEDPKSAYGMGKEKEKDADLA